MGHQIVYDDAEEIKLKAPDRSNRCLMFNRKLTGSDASEFSTICRKLRVTMNKATDENYQKLLNELIQTTQFDEKLLTELLKLVFDRVSKNFSDLYQNIILYFSVILKKHDFEKYSSFIELLNDKCQTSLLTKSGHVLGTLRLIGFLYVEKLVNLQVIIQYFEKQEENTESRTEGLCTLLSIVSPYMVKEETEAINKAFELIENIDCQNFSKRLQFLVSGTLEKKNILKSPAEYTPRFSESEGKTRKKVSFLIGNEFQPVVSNKTKRILRHSVADSVKERLRIIVSDYVTGKKTLEPFEEIFEECKMQQRQLVKQIFKYALICFNREQEFLIICQMICEISVNIVRKEVVVTGIANTVEAIEDIKLDAPMAHIHLEFMIRHLKQNEIVEEDEYLLRRLVCPILRKYSESEEGLE